MTVGLILGCLSLWFAHQDFKEGAFAAGWFYTVFASCFLVPVLIKLPGAVLIFAATFLLGFTLEFQGREESVDHEH